MTPKKLIFLLLIIFSTISFIRLLILTSITSDPIHTLLSPPPPPPPPPPPHPSLSSQNHLRLPNPRNPPPIPAESDPLSPKELHLLQTLISIKSPCNLLFFGITPQLLDLAKSNNRGGNTIFLVNEFDRPREIQGIGIGIGIYRVECEEKSKQSYDLLKYARITPTCRPNDGPVYESRCRLAFRGLPEIVNKVRWDVIVVDGPGDGGGPEAPGRMAAIYTAALIARAGNSTDVLVHNVDRTIEKWYSWEFLCSENLVSSKGRLWHFSIRGRSNSGRFCNEPAFKIQ